MSKVDETPLALTAAQLQALVEAAVTSAVREMKRPSDVEQSKIDADMKAIQEANETRKENAQQVLSDLKQKKWKQATCNHKRRDGTSRAVYVQNGNFIICQMCQAVVMPELQKACGGDYIFDTRLFNELMQAVGSSDIFA